MRLSESAGIEIAKPQAEVFEYLTTAFHEFLKAWLIYPAVESVAMTGDELAVGAKRAVYLSDGGELPETITRHEPPTRHSYTWQGGVTFPNSILIISGGGDWRFSGSDHATRVRWTYSFELTSPLWWPVGKPMMIGYREWMIRGLGRAKSILEEDL